MIPDALRRPVHVAPQLRARGLDLSSNQSVQQTRQVVAKGVDFGIVKATQGTGYVNPLLLAQVTELASFKRTAAIGLYHFLDATDGALQWDHFEATITRSKLPARPYLVACDYEGDYVNAHGDDVCRAFLRRGKQRGYRVGLYGSQNVTARKMGQAWTWAARWSTTPPPYRWDVWQFADGPVCDWNVFRGDVAELRRFVAQYAGRSVLTPPARWWLHDQTAGKSLGPYRSVALAAARLVSYVVSNPHASAFTLRRV